MPLVPAPRVSFDAGGSRYVLALESGALLRMEPAAERALSAAERGLAVDPHVGETLEAAGLLVDPGFPAAPPDLRGVLPAARLVIPSARDLAGACAYTFREAPSRPAAATGSPGADPAGALRDLWRDAGGRRMVWVDVHLDAGGNMAPRLLRIADLAHDLSVERGVACRLHAIGLPDDVSDAVAALLAERFGAVTVLATEPEAAGGLHDRFPPLARLLSAAPGRVRARLVLGEGDVPALSTFDRLVAEGFVLVGHAVTGVPGPRAIEGFRVIFAAEAARFAGGGPLRSGLLAFLFRQIHRGESRVAACGAGLTSRALDGAGGLRPCHRSCSGAPADGVPRAGLPAACRDCVARPWCAGGCPHAASVLAGDPAGVAAGRCAIIRGVVEEALRLYVTIEAGAGKGLDRLDIEDLL